MDLGNVGSFQYHRRNVSFGQIEKGASCFPRVSARVEGTEQLLKDLSHVEERGYNTERRWWHLLEATPGWNGSSTSPGEGAWDFTFPEGTEVGRGIIGSCCKTSKKEWFPQFPLPQFSFPKERKSPKKIEQPFQLLPWSKRTTSDKSLNLSGTQFTHRDCLAISEVPKGINDTKHLPSANICHMLKYAWNHILILAIHVGYLIYLYSSPFKYYHFHLMWRDRGLEMDSELFIVTKLVRGGARIQRLVCPVLELVLLWVMPDFLHSVIFTIINRCESFVKKEEPLVWDRKNELDIIHSFAPCRRGSLAPSSSLCLLYLPS